MGETGRRSGAAGALGKVRHGMIAVRRTQNPTEARKFLRSSRDRAGKCRVRDFPDSVLRGAVRRMTRWKVRRRESLSCAPALEFPNGATRAMDRAERHWRWRFGCVSHYRKSSAWTHNERNRFRVVAARLRMKRPHSNPGKEAGRPPLGGPPLLLSTPNPRYAGEVKL
jgi:hypothetical protein